MKITIEISKKELAHIIKNTGKSFKTRLLLDGNKITEAFQKANCDKASEYLK